MNVDELVNEIRSELNESTERNDLLDKILETLTKTENCTKIFELASIHTCIITKLGWPTIQRSWMLK